jgi:hypothetical protein
MKVFRSSHVLLDSHPFGGCNTVFDAVLTRTPMVLYEGTRWNNRIGPAILRLVLPAHANVNQYATPFLFYCTLLPLYNVCLCDIVSR